MHLQLSINICFKYQNIQINQAERQNSRLKSNLCQNTMLKSPQDYILRETNDSNQQYLLMLRIKQKEEQNDEDVAEKAQKIKKLFRKQERNAIFAEIRREAARRQQNYKMEQEPRQQPAIFNQQVEAYPQFYQNNAFEMYLNYLRHVAPQLHLPSPPLVLQPIIQPINRPHQNPIIIDPNIYFEKNGVIVFRNELGKGSFSIVWQGKIKATGERVAVKEVVKLQQAEIKCLQTLFSDHIIKIFSVFTRRSHSYIVLEYCDRSLRQELDRGNLKFEKAVKYFQQILKGMDVLQSKNILHRDLKFENILLKNGVIKISDFGLAKELGDELQVQSRRCGTSYTMAPQVYFSNGKRASYTIKSDIWSLGIILHEMLYRIHPFDYDRARYRNQQRIQVQQKFGILDKIINQSLIFDPSSRLDWYSLKKLFSYYLEERKKIRDNYREIDKREPFVEIKELRNFKRKEIFLQDQNRQKEKIEFSRKILRVKAKQEEKNELKYQVREKVQQKINKIKRAVPELSPQVQRKLKRINNIRHEQVQKKNNLIVQKEQKVQQKKKQNIPIMKNERKNLFIDEIMPQKKNIKEENVPQNSKLRLLMEFLVLLAFFAAVYQCYNLNIAL